MRRTDNSQNNRARWLSECNAYLKKEKLIKLKRIVRLTVIIFLLISSRKIVSAQIIDSDCGIVWHEPILISDSAYEAVVPRIVLAGDDTVCISWWSGYNKSYTHFFRLPFRRSVDGGKTFEPTRDLIEDTITFTQQTHIPGIVANRNNVYIIFPYPHTRLWMMKSTDYGTTWNTPRNITTGEVGYLYKTAIYKDSLACIIEGNGYQLWKSANGGVTSTITNLPRSDETAIALTPGTLHLVQHLWKNNAMEVNYLRSTNLGNSWNQNIILSTIDGMYSDIPSIAGYKTECGTELLATWRDVKYGGMGFAGASIISRTSLNNGNTWLPESLLTRRELPNGFYAKVAVHGNTRAVTWNTEGEEAIDTIHSDVRVSNSSLLNYCPIRRVTEKTTNGGGIQIAISTHAVHVVYEDVLDGRLYVYYRRGEFIRQNVQLSLSSGSIDFDTTEVNTTRSDTVLVANSGTDPLIIGTAISNNTVFSVTPQSVTIEPSKSEQLVISYMPAKQGFDNGRVIFYHNGESSPDCFAVTGIGKWGMERIAYPQGWQIVSIPIKPGPNQVLPSLYEYNNGYIQASKMKFGQGYWAKPPDTVFYLGGRMLSDSLNVKEGWNIIGALSKPTSSLTMTSSPMNIIDSPFYGFNDEGYYVADVLQPGMGYWVKIREDGKLFLSAEDMAFGNVQPEKGAMSNALMKEKK
ncbi:MAG: hypothetical protein HYZ34_01915 [Ignavibacteriae bacterium]|nr:hypothetical protein [Ignavibacteriota bacterium]